ncbi:hypothetical protein C7M84_018135 [Penaeus vannamei]|uniref:PiggyBac transposable element-derived protein domain-containing protein n=1 Tax=Penaeus vannamei TaxID=6689 RepID=A0A423SIA0_PENVA|nr:hypothetical protein C7M84_018135 [Penaeus vannamei]
MSRQLRTQRCRSSKYSHAVRNLYDSDPDDPRPSTSGEGPRRLRNAPESHFYLYETASGRGEMREALDSSAQPANSGRSTAIPNIPDSDWDMDVDDSDDDADYSPEATESDADWEEFDYVSSHDTSIDSDEPLSAVARRFAMRNAPGTPGFVWKKKRPFVRRHPPQGVPGVEEACLLHADSTAREILDCFLTPELWDTMTRETNRYVEQRPVTPSSHMKTWENTTVEELQSFIGLRLLMGLQPRPHSRYYWSKNRLLSSSVFPETMTRDRFDLLQSRLHFSDNEDPRADTDRLWKLRPVLDILDTRKDLKVSARGDVDFRTSATGMLAMSWMDRKPVHMLSTIHGPDMVDLPPNRRGIVRTKPQAVVDYNVGKKGVDLADQLAASYSTTRRTNKWYQNVFYHLLDMAAVNAFVVHRALGGTLTQLEFRLEIIANFLDQPPAYGRRGGLRTPPAATPSPPRRRNAPRQQQRQQVPQGHVLAFNPGRKYRRCRHCRVSRNVRKETRYSSRLSFSKQRRKIHDATSSGKRKIHDAASSSRRTPHAASSSRRITPAPPAAEGPLSSSRRPLTRLQQQDDLSRRSSRRTAAEGPLTQPLSSSQQQQKDLSRRHQQQKDLSRCHQQWKGLSRRLQQQDDLSRRNQQQKDLSHQQQKDLSRRLQQQDDLSRRPAAEGPLTPHQQQKDLSLSRETSSGRTSHAASSSRMISSQQQKDAATSSRRTSHSPLTAAAAAEGPLTPAALSSHAATSSRRTLTPPQAAGVMSHCARQIASIYGTAPCSEDAASPISPIAAGYRFRNSVGRSTTPHPVAKGRSMTLPPAAGGPLTPPQQQEDLTPPPAAEGPLTASSSRRTSHLQQQEDLSRRHQQQKDLSCCHQQQKDLSAPKDLSRRHQQQKDLSRRPSRRTRAEPKQQKDLSRRHQQQKDLSRRQQHKDLSRAAAEAYHATTSSRRTSHTSSRRTSAAEDLSRHHQQQKDLSHQQQQKGSQPLSRSSRGSLTRHQQQKDLSRRHQQQKDLSQQQESLTPPPAAEGLSRRSSRGPLTPAAEGLSRRHQQGPLTPHQQWKDLSRNLQQQEDLSLLVATGYLCSFQ